MKHYGRFLPSAGRLVEYRTREIEEKQSEYLKLKEDLEQVKQSLDQLEVDFFRYALKDWSIEEITAAKNKCKSVCPESYQITWQIGKNSIYK